MTLELRDEAARCVSRGWALIALQGKTPVLKGWQQGSAASLDQALQWVEAGHNLGVRTGPASGVVVIDDDAGVLSGLPRTPTALTGGFDDEGKHKRHFYFKNPAGVEVRNSAGKLAPGVDVRGAGGYVVAPGSIHPETHERYTWAPGLSPEEVGFAELPAEIIAKLVKPDEERPAPPAPAASHPVAAPKPRRREQSYAAAALAKECDAVAGTGKGQRNHALNTASFNVGQLVAGGLLYESEATAALADAAARCGLGQSEAAKTIASGLTAGKAKPRTAPEPKSADAATATAAAKAAPAGTDDNGTLPQIQVNGRPLDCMTRDAANAWGKANVPPTHFCRGNAIVRVVRDKDGRPIIQQCDLDHLRYAIARAARYVKLTKAGDINHVPPPMDLVRDLRSLTSWPFLPALEAIIELPSMRPDGSIITQPGYDSTTRLYFEPAPGFVLPPIPDEPSVHDVEAAVAAAEYPFAEFPFADQASRANVLALMLTTCARPLVAGPVPLAIIDAPTMGSGKTLLAESISAICVGRESWLLTVPGTDDEMSKAITAKLYDGASFINMDNTEAVLSHASLASVLTRTTWEQRLLGRNDQVLRLLNRATWLATGNNIRLGGDMARRCYWIRLDAQTDRPWTRGNFKIPDLLRWVAQHRADLLAALLTICRGWVTAGRPPATSPPRMGSFEGWVGAISGMLEYAGVAGFLGNADALIESDDEGAEWQTFIEAWHLRWSSTPVGVDELVRAATDDRTFADAMPSWLAEALDRGIHSAKKRLGKALSRKRDTRYSGGFMLQRAGDNLHRGSALWRVVQVVQA